MTDTEEADIEYNTQIFNGGDFVFMKDEKGSIMSGGYKINSLFLEEDIPIMTTYNKMDQYGGKVSSPFENLAVPAGLFYINTKVSKKDSKTTSDNQFNNHKMAPDEIVDKLFSLIEFDKKRKRKTKKNNAKQNKKHTRKHK
jgi:hypothetical protein